MAGSTPGYPSPSAPNPANGANGRPIDPSENVKALTEAAVKRLDDLQEAGRRYNEARIDHLKEVADLRSLHDVELRHAESGRIDAIRSTDVGNVQRDKEVAAAAAEALRNQVAAAATASASSLAAAATALQTSLAAVVDPIKSDIADLRRVQYEQVGQKAQVVETRDSAADFAPVLAAIAALQAQQQQSQGGRAQTVESRAMSNWLIGLVLAAIAVFGLYTATQDAPAPVVIEVPTAPTTTT